MSHLADLLFAGRRCRDRFAAGSLPMQPSPFLNSASRERKRRPAKWPPFGLSYRSPFAACTLEQSGEPAEQAASAAAAAIMAAATSAAVMAGMMR